MKIVCTITDVSAVVHAGGQPESMSCILDVPDESLPRLLKKEFENRAWNRAHDKPFYSSIALSVLEDEP